MFVLLASGVQSLDFGTIKVIFGAPYLRRSQRFLQDPHAGYRHRKAFEREYGKHGSVLINAVSLSNFRNLSIFHQILHS